ncbi:hypothetical protein [Frankia sp. AgB32]|uniref:hypothetical protein n=1 Tax=Frankia sp. AgB32 TaxID=631119 RepID=UPI00200BAAB8|nr:hypothetical protein [Frankia sp. AgB32]MCK9893031.1 hypothetical protein [Frankia sp. AgB32]
MYDANVGDARDLGQRIRASGADTKVILSVGGYGRHQLQKYGARIAGLSYSAVRVNTTGTAYDIVTNTAPAAPPATAGAPLTGRADDIPVSAW